MEQRRASRIPVDLPARTRSGVLELDGRAGNLSQDGMYFESPLPHPDLAKVLVDLLLPDEPAPLSITAEVRWVRGGGMGMRFQGLAREDRLLIANYVLRRASARAHRGDA